MIIGLTGPTGTGKSTVTGILGELSCAVIDCDQTARQALVDCEPCVQELWQEFGDDIVGKNGSVDRALLAHRAFSSRERTHRLNGIIHPWILRQAQKEIDEWKATSKEFITVNAPLLSENGAEKLCDKIPAVVTPLSVRLERVIRQDNIDHEMALSCIRAQQENAYYMERSDACLRGDEDPGELRRQAATLLGRWRRWKSFPRRRSGAAELKKQWVPR